MKPHLRSLPLLAFALCLASAALPARGGDTVSFGVVTDIQYGDKDSRGPRKYRKSLKKLPACVATFNARPLDFVIELGDLMDGYRSDEARSLQDLDRVLPLLRGIKAPLYYVIGNHCMNGGRAAVIQRLGLKTPYYEFTRPTAPGWRFVVLDGTLAGYGVLGPEQEAWLRTTLEKADKAGERVICFCHMPVLQPEGQHHGMQKPELLAALLRQYRCVAAWFSGHDHQGGYILADGIHYLNFKGMVEAKNNAYAIVTLEADRIRVEGFGDEPSRELKLPPRK
jgi:3',5'-cyclic AMP phosphodiesterase CpdA